MYSTFNEGKSVAAERLFRLVKTRFTSIWQLFQRIFILMCLMILLTKYNNTFHRTIKMKPINVTSDSYAEYNVDSNEKDPKFKVGDRVRISKYKKFFSKECTQSWSE